MPADGGIILNSQVFDLEINKIGFSDDHRV
jgi:hypothetical protein